MRVRPAFRIATIYFVFGAAWIGLSDHVALALTDDTVLLELAQLLKGWAFVAASAIVIHLLVAAELRRTSRMQESLRRTTDELEAIIQSAPVAILSLDPAGRVTLWNPAAEQAFGWTAEEVLGRQPPIVPPDKADEFGGLVARVGAGERIHGLELERVRKDGSKVHLMLSAAPLRDAGGRIRGTMAMLLDVSEQKRLLEQFLHAQKLEAVGRFAGGIAHDFNNILTAIDGTAQLALEEHDLPDTARLDLLDIRRSAGRAAALTRKLLIFSRRSEAEERVLDLNALIRDLNGMLRRVVGPDVEIATELTEDPAPVMADPGQLEQVVTNLVVNARDAMPEGGRITIVTAAARVPANGVAGRPEPGPGRYTLLIVRDTGVGMPAAIRERVFEPFFTTKARDKGTGLGLSTVYGIVKQAGGVVRVESEPGRGTTFTIWLPTVDAAHMEEPVQPDGAGGAAEPASNGSGKDAGSVLVVEDEAAVRALVVRVLERQGYRVTEAGSAPDALEHVERAERPFDLVIADTVLPGMSGPELVERLREAMPTARVLLTSGYSRPDLAGRGVAVDRLAFLQKPFSPSTLLETAREVLAADPAKDRANV